MSGSAPSAPTNWPPDPHTEEHPTPPGVSLSGESPGFGPAQKCAGSFFLASFIFLRLEWALFGFGKFTTATSTFRWSRRDIGKEGRKPSFVCPSRGGAAWRSLISAL